MELVHADTATHKGDLFTKDMPPKAFRENVALLRVSERARTAGQGPVRGELPAAQ